MNNEHDSNRWVRLGFSHEPRGGMFSWGMMVLAVAYSVVAPPFYPHLIVAVPFVLLFPLAEVLPTERVRLARTLRVVAFAYLLTTPLLFVLFF